MSTNHMFKKATRDEWIAKANEDLKGKIKAENLRYEIEPGLDFSPFLTHGEIKPQTPISGHKTSAGVKIMAENETEANQKSKIMLLNGAETLAFDIDEHTNFDKLFDGVFLDMISVILYTSDSISIQKALQSYLIQNYHNKATSITISDIKNTVRLRDTLSFRERISTAYHFLSSVHENYTIQVELKNDFLAQISELRALRIMAQSKNRKAIILCVSKIADVTSTDIHPLIINNYQLMSAYLGMSDVAFGLPFYDDAEIARLSLNIHHVLKEESGFGFVDDPTAGAYVIEKITQELLNIN